MSNTTEETRTETRGAVTSGGFLRTGLRWALGGASVVAGLGAVAKLIERFEPERYARATKAVREAVAKVEATVRGWLTPEVTEPEVDEDELARRRVALEHEREHGAEGRARAMAHARRPNVPHMASQVAQLARERRIQRHV